MGFFIVMAVFLHLSTSALGELFENVNPWEPLHITVFHAFIKHVCLIILANWAHFREIHIE